MSGLSDGPQQAFGDLTARTPLSRQDTTTSLDGNEPQAAPRIMTVNDMTRVLMEVRDSQDTLVEKLLAAAGGTDERCQETGQLLAELTNRVDVQGQEMMSARATDQKEASETLRELMQHVEALQAQESAQLQELREARGDSARSSEDHQKRLSGVADELQSQALVLKALQQASKDTTSQLREELQAQDPRAQIGELSKETAKLLADLGRQVESLRNPEVPERVSELQRGFEALQRSVEALRTSESQHMAEMQRSAESNSQSLQYLRAQDTGQKLIELQRLVETQSRSLEAARSQDAMELRRVVEAQGTQLSEALRSQDSEKKLSDLRKSTEALADLLQEMKPRVQETSAGLGYITTAMATHSTGLQDLASQAVARHQAMSQSLTDLRLVVDGLVKPASVEELGTKVGEIQQALVSQEKRSDQRDVSLEAAFEETLKTIKESFNGFSHSSVERHEGLSSALDALRAQIEAVSAESVAQQQSQQQLAEELLESSKTASQAQSSGFRDACEQVTSSTLDALSSLQRRFEDTDGGVQSLQSSVSSQSRQLEQLQKQVLAQQEASQAQSRELQELRKGLANEAACEGLRRELDASKIRQESLEAEKVARAKVWDEERTALEKEVARLRGREATLVQQLQQAIVPLPAEVPPPELKKQGFGFSAYFAQARMRGKAVTFVLLASMCCFIVGIVLFFWPVTPAPPTEASAAGRGFFRHGAAWAGPAGPTKALRHLRLRGTQRQLARNLSKRCAR